MPSHSNLVLQVNLVVRPNFDPTLIPILEGRENFPDHYSFRKTKISLLKLYQSKRDYSIF